jgi:hypothetical protein
MVAGEIFFGWWRVFFAGVFAKSGVRNVVFDGEIVVDWW